MTTATIVFVALVAYSLLLEVCQIWVSGRFPSPHDVAAQCLGAVCGMSVWVWRGPAIANRIWSFFKPLANRGVWGMAAVGYVVGVVAYSLHPLDLTLHPTELWRKWKAGHVVLLPLADDVPVADLAISCARQALIFLPVGLLWQAFRSEAGKPRRAITVALVLSPVAVEFLQLFAYSRWASATHAAAGLLGMATGHCVSLAYRSAKRRWYKSAGP